jgi:hypothetical protein
VPAQAQTETETAICVVFFSWDLINACLSLSLFSMKVRYIFIAAALIRFLEELVVPQRGVFHQPCAVHITVLYEGGGGGGEEGL